MSKYHIKHNPQANELAKQERHDDWKRAHSWHMRPTSDSADLNKPRLWIWVEKEYAADRVAYTRNPYFYQVDPDGNQLPYLDQVDITLTGNVQVHVLKAVSGEFDVDTYFLTLGDMPVLKENEQRGGYKTALSKSLRISDLALQPNQTIADPTLRKLFQTRDFRIALSHGMDRDAMNNTIYFGLGTVCPVTPLPGMSFYKPEWSSMYLQYDVAKANQLLDSVGLTKKDAQGFRLRPDKDERLLLNVEFGEAYGPRMQILEMLKEQYVKLGLELVIKQQERTLFDTRRTGNLIEVVSFTVDRVGLFGRADPLWWGWDGVAQHNWAPEWARWFGTSGKEGLEPPAEIKKQADLMAQFRQTLPGTPEFNKLGAEYYDWYVKEVPMIGTVGLIPQPLLVSNKIHNVPTEGIYWAADTNYYAPWIPAQWYKD